MTKISVYPTISSPLGDDILIGTDIHHQDATKNFMISDMFAIGLETSVTKLKIYDPTLFGYGEISLDNDVFRVKGAPTNTRNLLVSSATGYLSFKKNNYDVKLDATSVTDDRTYTLQNTDGTVALVETTSLQQVTDNGDTTTNEIFIPKLNLFDSVSQGYASIQCIDSEWSFENAANQSVFGINPGGITLKNNSSTYYGNISPQLITSYTNYSLPNKSGTFALTSDLRPYKVFTALLTQSGVDTEDTISSGLLTIGVTYHINTDSPGMDFTNVGAPNNNVGTAFIATGTTPASWGSGGSLTLAYSAGAPVATVLENTIGNIWFTYNGVGNYFISKENAFDPSKTVIFIGPPTWDGGNFYFQSGTDGISEIFLFSNLLETISPINNAFQNTPIEIRVYND